MDNYFTILTEDYIRNLKFAQATQARQVLYAREQTLLRRKKYITNVKLFIIDKLCQLEVCEPYK